MASLSFSTLCGTSAVCLAASAVGAAPAFQSDPNNRKADRPTELWRYYMHGVTDFFAEPLKLKFKGGTPSATELKTPYFKEKIDEISLAPDKKAVSSSIDVATYRGRTIRIFYWMRGEPVAGAVMKNSYSDAPQLLAVVKDAKNKMLSRKTSHNGAVGKFPWHGYYLDVKIPSKGKKLYLVLDNSKTRRAWFGKFALEPVGKNNTYSQNEKQDPDTGSIAAFPWYEPINFHFFAKPPATKYIWNFMRGPAAGMIGQPYDLTTVDGLRKYYQESVKYDLDQMNHGIMYFPNRYRLAKRKGVLPPLPENWLLEVGKLVNEDQDPETGYWGTKYIPLTMSVTFHFVDMLYAFGIQRYDEPAKPDPGRCVAPTLPRPDKMVDTTLKLQSTCMVDGKKELAAWSQRAYNFTDKPDGGRSRCALGSTMNAIRLLRICYRFVGPEQQKQSDRSVKAAFKYVLTHCVNSDGLWKQQDVDSSPTKSAYYMSIVSYSHYLEKRTDTSIPKPELKVASGPSDNEISISCPSWKDRQNSFRIYAAGDKKVEPEKLQPEMIVGFISKGDKKIIEMDPLLSTIKSIKSSKDNWNSKFSSRKYYGKKVVKLLRKKRPAVTGSDTLRISRESLPAGTKELWITAVDWYGAESTPVKVIIP